MNFKPIKPSKRFILHRDNTVSVRRGGKWRHFEGIISVRDFKRLDLREQRRIVRARITIVAEYGR
jgi:hypothetical protein